jgi:hypothetical protein
MAKIQQKPKRAKLIRSDSWKLAHGGQLPAIITTLASYRLFVRFLMGVIYAHWELIAPLEDELQQKFVENLIHTTKKNQAKYTIFDKKFHKFPSYLRRAAITAAIGQVSSFVTRYVTWQSGIRKKRIAKPPRLGKKTNLFP